MTRREHHNPTRPPRSPRAFTLVEIIVAVSILAIVGVLMGTIFATVGETVTQGRRVSNMNRFASRIERVMRRDFENMVREDGFLVIRNELTNDYQNDPSKVDVPLTITDPNGRPRRIDEIMFFSRGDFTSRRTPLHRDMIARSNTARVYYGHGQRMAVDYGLDPDRPDYETRYTRPRLDDPNGFINGRDARLGAPSAAGVVNPNEFAADWSLLRHVTLLVSRQGGLQELPDDIFGLQPNGTGAQNRDDYNRIADSSRQVALGPAAQSVFRAVSHMVPFEVADRPDSTDLVLINEPDFNIRPVNAFAVALNGGSDGPADGTLVRPLFTSGLVDVAVTDLEEIRTTVTSPWLRLNPASVTAIEAFPTVFTPYDYSTDVERLGYEQGRAFIDAQNPSILIPLVGTVLSKGSLPPSGRYQTQQLWMLDALPSTPFDSDEPNHTGFRVRYEPTPPRVYLDDGTVLANTTADQATRMNIAIEQADQEMLASSVFLPRCTEFIVEFSLGIIDRRDPVDNPNYGQPIWHGLRRYRDNPGSGSSGQYDEGTFDDTLFADLFSDEYGGDALTDEIDEIDDEFNIRAALGDWFFEDGNVPQEPTAGAIDPEMIQLVRVDQRFDNDSLGGSAIEDVVAAEYCFGYVYQDQNNTPNDPDDDTVRPWPWPKLIRVTMRFVDPSDLETERIYQVEFRVPSLAGEM